MTCEIERYDFFVRGDIPPELEGSVLLCTGRRSKNREEFARWQDSTSDLIKLTIRPGSPGSVTGEVLLDPAGLAAEDLDFRPNQYEQRARGDLRYGYATQPNHGINVGNGSVWGTNLVFGAPLEVDIKSWRPKRIRRCVEPAELTPRLTSTAHFAWSKDGRYAYYQQALLSDGDNGSPVKSSDQCLVRLDTSTGEEKAWPLHPPKGDSAVESHNFHSAFYWEERGVPHVGLLRTGAVFGSLAPHPGIDDHTVHRMAASDIWIVKVEENRSELFAKTLPGIGDLDYLALSHLDIDNDREDGFVLYANSKESDVSEETHGVNIYGQHPCQVAEHYSGMITEAINVGGLLRYEYGPDGYDLKTFHCPYVPGRSSRGHTWLPINIELDAKRRHLYCTFSGFRPRLLPLHIVKAYGDRTVPSNEIRDVPSLLMRFDAETLQPTYTSDRSYLSYYESLAIAVVGDTDTGHVLTFSPEFGLRIYRASDLSTVVAHALGHEMWHVGDTHFRTMPAHMVFVPG